MKAGLPELSGGDVYPYTGDRHTLAFPALELPAHLFDHPRADGNDQAALLGRRHELARGQESPLRVLPMHQRFDGFDTVIGKTDLRLIQQHELPMLDRSLQTGRW